MLDLIIEAKAEAERELILAQAKMQVCDTLIGKYEAKFAERTVADDEDVAVADTEGADEGEVEQGTAYLNI